MPRRRTRARRRGPAGRGSPSRCPAPAGPRRARPSLGRRRAAAIRRSGPSDLETERTTAQRGPSAMGEREGGRARHRARVVVLDQQHLRVARRGAARSSRARRHAERGARRVLRARREDHGLGPLARARSSSSGARLRRPAPSAPARGPARPPGPAPRCSRGLPRPRGRRAAGAPGATRSIPSIEPATTQTASAGMPSAAKARAASCRQPMGRLAVEARPARDRAQGGRERGQQGGVRVARRRRCARLGEAPSRDGGGRGEAGGRRACRGGPGRRGGRGGAAPGRRRPRWPGSRAGSGRARARSAARRPGRGGLRGGPPPGSAAMVVAVRPAIGYRTGMVISSYYNKYEERPSMSELRRHPPHHPEAPAHARRLRPRRGPRDPGRGARVPRGLRRGRPALRDPHHPTRASGDRLYVHGSAASRMLRSLAGGAGSA